MPAQEYLQVKVEEHEEGHPFFPGHVLRDAVIFFVLFGILITLAVLLPWHLHAKADPLVTPPGIKPEWYFLPMYQSLKYVPELLGIAAQGIIFGLLFFWPFADAIIDRRLKRPRLYVIVGIIGLAGCVVTGFLGYISDRHFTLGGQQYEFSIKGWPHKVTEAPPAPITPTPPAEAPTPPAEEAEAGQ